MGIMKTKEKCPHCKEYFILEIKRESSKLDNKRNTYFICPNCNQPAGNILLDGNEEDCTYKMKNNQGDGSAIDK